MSLLLTGIFPETNFPKVIQKVGLFKYCKYFNLTKFITKRPVP